jgi:hypothetical protein
LRRRGWPRKIGQIRRDQHAGAGDGADASRRVIPLAREQETGGPKIVPIAAAAEKSIKLVTHGAPQVYPGAPYGIYGAYQEALDKDILDFIAD